MTSAAEVFENVTLEWKGVAFDLPASHILRTAALIEEIITLRELSRFSAQKKVPVAKLAMAYGVCLRYVGAKVQDDQIYAEMMQAGMMQPALIGQVTTNLLKILVPKSAEKPKERPVRRPRRRA